MKSFAVLLLLLVIGMHAVLLEHFCLFTAVGVSSFNVHAEIEVGNRYSYAKQKPYFLCTGDVFLFPKGFRQLCLLAVCASAIRVYLYILEATIVRP